MQEAKGVFSRNSLTIQDFENSSLGALNPKIARQLQLLDASPAE